ncbi:LamG-like jellyroll fold domain-containing protein [Rubritalea tangerina]|uniref:LamG-like jellyroll fold domain-containing protein n=1 Tax=Rubritalea tangerina TaxID=430798 RepID=A0ABW4ZCE8_9BACT
MQSFRILFWSILLSIYVHADAELKAYWKLDGNFSNNKPVHQKQNFSPHNSPTFSNDSVSGKSLRLDRSKQQYLLTSSPIRKANTPAHSVSLWFKPETLPKHGSRERYFLFESVKGETTDDAGAIHLSLGFWAGATPNTVNLQTWTQTIDKATGKPIAQGGFDYHMLRSELKNQWTHLVLSFDSNTFKIYLDGKLAKTHFLPKPGPAAPFGGIVFGGHREGIGRNFDGLLDEVSIWQGNLSNANIQKLYTSKQPKTAPLVIKGKAPEELRLLVWNIWGRLNQAEKYNFEGKSARQRTIEIIKESKADIIGMIETYGSAADIAKGLGYHYYTPSKSANLTIFSKYELSDFGTPKGLSSFSFITATAHLSPTKKLRVYCIWLTSGGRHIVSIKDPKLSDKDFINGDNNRRAMLEKFLSHPSVTMDLENAENLPVVVMGDFNCVSHLDYTKESKSADLNYQRVFADAPTHTAMLEKGFTDTYRAMHPRLTQETLGYTWTTVGLDHTYVSGKGFEPVAPSNNPRPQNQDPYARIDFIYSLGSHLSPSSSQVIKHYKNHTKRSFPEFPSDHAAVLSTFKISQ